jgi:hypothetical protein
MSGDFRLKNGFSIRDAAKVAVVIVSLLLGCIVLLWGAARLLRNSSQPAPESPASVQPYGPGN